MPGGAGTPLIPVLGKQRSEFEAQSGEFQASQDLHGGGGGGSPCSPASQVLVLKVCATTTGCFSFSIWVGLAHEWAHDYHKSKSVTGRRAS